MSAQDLMFAKQAWIEDDWDGHVNLVKFAALVRADEREACAKVCDEYDIAEDVNSSDTAEGIALAIRARENK